MGKLRVGIVGAGISGLTCAYQLGRASRRMDREIEISLFDRTNRPGGVIRTEQKDGFLFEWGPENFVPLRPGLLELVDELGLSGRLLGSNDQVRQTYVVNGGGLRPLPEGMAFLAPVHWRALWGTPGLSVTGKLRASMEPLIRPGRGDLSVYAFMRRRLGRELAEKVAEPLVSAIYGGDAKKLSTASAIPQTYQLEQQFGSLYRGMRAKSRARRSGNGHSGSFFLSFREGMSELVSALQSHSQGVSFFPEHDGFKLFSRGGEVGLKGPGLEAAFDRVIVATPAGAAAGILEPLSPTAAGALRGIPYTSTTLVYLAYRKNEFSHPLNGFGFVVPSRESAVIDACTWVSRKFEARCPADLVLLRCAIHNGRRPRSEEPPEQTAEKVHREIQRLLGVSCQPAVWKVGRAAGGMPQPTVGHAERLGIVNRELTNLPKVFLTGAFAQGVGIPTCVASAQEVCRRLLQSSTCPN